MPDIASILDSLDEAFDRKSWHGTNLRGSLRGLSAAQAAARPAPRRHSIWELTLHCAYWKYVARRRLTGDKRGSFPLPGSNFFPQPAEPTSAAWKQAVDLLTVHHRQLRQSITALAPQALESPAVAKILRGIAAHDLYHAGQIQLIKRLTTTRL